MKAAFSFVQELQEHSSDVARIVVSLHGSLAWTGKGHGSDSAVLLGLEGYEPETIDPDQTDNILATIHADKQINVPGVGLLAFDPATELQFDREEELARHTNGMRFRAFSENGELALESLYFSLGGGIHCTQ